MNKKQKNLTNKGFSLVELIIVIAIMAVLVGVLAPQFLKYVERSRKSTDCQNVASIVTALQTYAADPMVDSTKKLSTGTITLTASQTAVSASNASGNANEALDAAGIKKIGLKSSEWFDTGKTSIVINFTVGTDGSVTFSESNIKANHSILNGQYQ